MVIFKGTWLQRSSLACQMNGIFFLLQLQLTSVVHTLINLRCSLSCSSAEVSCSWAASMADCVCVASECRWFSALLSTSVNLDWRSPTFLCSSNTNWLWPTKHNRLTSLLIIATTNWLPSRQQQRQTHRQVRTMSLITHRRRKNFCLSSSHALLTIFSCFTAHCGLL